MRTNIVLKCIIFVIILILIKIVDFFLFIRGKRILSILCYHRINNDFYDSMTVSTEAFEKQILYLKKNYQVIAASELEDWLNGKTSKKKGVLITLDDGYEDNYTDALPILEKYSCPAIFFVPTGYVGTDKDFKFDVKDYPEYTFKKMSWDQLKHVANNGIEIGVHSDTHINFNEAGFEQTKMEIEESLNKYYTYFLRKSVLMAYPFGGKNDISEEIREYISQHEMISALFSAYGGRNVEPFDRNNLKRIFISSSDVGIILRYRIEGGLKALCP